MEHAEYMEKMEELNKRKREINEEIRLLEKGHSQYWIGIVSEGDGDYWDEYYTRLGFVTKDKVDAWLEKHEDAFMVEAMAVDKETYEKYYIWYRLQTIASNMNFKYDTMMWRSLSKEDMDYLDDCSGRIKLILDEFISDFVKHPAFMHITEDENLY